MVFESEISEADLMHAKASVSFKGMAGYRIKRYAKERGISEGLAVKELTIEGLKGLGLVHPSYSLSDMRQGL